MYPAGRERREDGLLLLGISRAVLPRKTLVRRSGNSQLAALKSFLMGITTGPANVYLGENWKTSFETARSSFSTAGRRVDVGSGFPEKAFASKGKIVGGAAPANFSEFLPQLRAKGVFGRGGLGGT